MSVIVAKHERWGELECIVLCTDSQATNAHKQTKGNTQKIYPVGNCFITGVGSHTNLKIAKWVHIGAILGGLDAAEAASCYLKTLLSHLPYHSISDSRVYTAARYVVSGPQNGGNGLGLYEISQPIDPGGSFVLEPHAALVMGTLQETQQWLAEEKPDNICALLLDVYSLAQAAERSIYVDQNFQFAVQTRSPYGMGAHALFPPGVEVNSLELLDAPERVCGFLGNKLVVPPHIESVDEASWLGEFHHVLITQLNDALTCRQRVEGPHDPLLGQTTEQLLDSYSAAMNSLSTSVSAFCSGDLSQVHSAVKAYHSSFS